MKVYEAPWLHRFEIKNGTWVFVPTELTREEGLRIKSHIVDRWTPPENFYHLRSGGHVEALRQHIGNQSFFRADIRDFFGSINRTRVTRELKGIFSTYKSARHAACSSVVSHPSGGRFILPYGYVQSPVIASLCLANSRLGRFINELPSKGFVSTVYMDDIVVSAPHGLDMDIVYQRLHSAACASGFELGANKTHGPQSTVEAFNINLTQGDIRITDKRLSEFVAEIFSASSAQRREGIINYIKSVNYTQYVDVLQNL